MYDGGPPPRENKSACDVIVGALRGDFPYKRKEEIYSTQNIKCVLPFVMNNASVLHPNQIIFMTEAFE